MIGFDNELQFHNVGTSLFGNFQNAFPVGIERRGIGRRDRNQTLRIGGRQAKNIAERRFPLQNRLLELFERGTDDEMLAAAFGVAWSWSAARADGRQQVFGGRAGLLPSILRLDDGTTVLDPSRALRFGPSPIDRLGRCALDRYADRYGLDRLEVSG